MDLSFDHGSKDPNALAAVTNLSFLSELYCYKNDRDLLFYDQLILYLSHFLDPSRRITSKSALEHEFFSSSPLPVSAERTLRHLPDNCFEMTAPQRPRQGGTHIPRPRETQAVGGGMGVLMGDRLY